MKRPAALIPVPRRAPIARVDRAESIAAVLEACDGYEGRVDDGSDPRSRVRARVPAWFAELARVAALPRPDPAAWPKERRRCKRCKNYFDRNMGSKVQYCSDCRRDIRAKNTKRAHRRNDAALLIACVRCGARPYSPCIEQNGGWAHHCRRYGAK